MFTPKDKDLMDKLVRAIEIATEVIRDTYKAPLNDIYAEERRETFKIILQKTIEELLKE